MPPALLSPDLRRRVRCLCWLGLLAAAILPAGSLEEKPAANAPAPPVSSTAAPQQPADLTTEFQQLEAAARALDPSAPDAVNRLRGMVERLARADAQLARELAELRAALAARTVAPVAGSPRAAAGSAVARKPGRGTESPAREAGSGVSSGPIFARRGLKKFHRAGCVFGERIRAEDRVTFPHAAAAAATGLEPCKVCRPE